LGYYILRDYKLVKMAPTTRIPHVFYTARANRAIARARRALPVPLSSGFENSAHYVPVVAYGGETHEEYSQQRNVHNFFAWLQRDSEALNRAIHLVPAPICDLSESL
jgi:hypothetical protein